MKLKQKKSNKSILSDKIADALTVKPRADIEDDQIFNTKPNTISRVDYSSESEDEAAISDFRKRTANLLSDISKKYEGRVVSRKELDDSFDGSDLSDDEECSRKPADNVVNDSEASTNGLRDNEDLLDKILDKIKSNSEEDTVGDSEESDDKSIIKKQIKKDLDKMTGKNKKMPHKVTCKQNTNHKDSTDDSDESDDYSIIKKQFKNIPDKVPGKSKKVSGKILKRIDDGVDDSEESDDYSAVKKLIQDEEKSDVSGEDEDEEEDGEGFDISQLDEPVKEEFEHVKKQNISEEAKKGACVRNQLLIWESLLEMRIHLQRCMNIANMMPMTEKYEELKECKEFEEECNVSINNISTVLDKFLTLQDLLLKNFPETKMLSTNKKQIQTIVKAKEESDEEIPSDTDNEEIPSDTEPEDNIEQEKPKLAKSKVNNTVQKKRKLEDYESDLSTTHKAIKTFRDTTIQKWNEKTRLATAANIKTAPTNTILQQISYILSDRHKLIRRTQLKRSDYDIIGYEKAANNKQDEETNIGQNGMMKDRKDNDEYIPEIFDDSDFYHQLLRELIECKSADISDPVQLSRQWIALQQMRSKMKRKVDTRATKGRKIKYVVHNPLVSYMAPEKSLKWNEGSTNELYNSLFGKMFENNNVGINVDLESVKIK